MCGRYTLTQSGEAIAQAFGLAEIPDLAPRHNIAPSQNVAVVGRANAQCPRQLKLFRWGLIPHWAKDQTIGSRLINARAETVADKPAFREAVRHRRCLVVADGFYEWQSPHRSEANASQSHASTTANACKLPAKQPYYFRHITGQPMGFAGLWESWISPQGEKIRSCTILTTTANEVLQPIHQRMPVILQPKDYDRWLEPGSVFIQDLRSLLMPSDPKRMERYPVSPRVNRPSYDQQDCIRPMTAKGLNGEPK